MNEISSDLLEGYIFELKGYLCNKGKTTVIMRVSGDGSAAYPLTAWILEFCPDDEKNKYGSFNIVSCEKRRSGGPWVPAGAQNTSYELTGDIGVSGVMVEERIETDADEPEMEFRITVEGETGPGSVRVAYIAGDDVFCSSKRIRTDPPEIVWMTPIEKTFCLYFVVSDGYKPEGACKANVSITKRGAFVAHEAGSFDAGDEICSIPKKIRTDLLGCVKIFASIPIKSFQACGDTAHASACDCFEINETVGYSDEENMIEIRDLTVCPKRKSYDLTLLSSHCGKSVYRLDGEYIINCKRCG
jgi:hypothetical protein